MDIRQLRYFYTIAKTGQITRAAKELHMAQPPLSQSLKSLEDNLGVKLFDRNGRKMELTEAGLILYRKTERLLHFLDETKTEVKETGKGIKGKLSIGCVKSCFSLLPKRLKLFRDLYPNVSIELREGDTFRLTEQLHNRNIDLAIVRLPLELKPFSFYPLPNEKYVAIVPESWISHKKEDYISLKELAKMPLLLLHRISGIGQYELIMDQFENSGLKPNIVCECPDVDMIIGLVNEEIGATIVPESAITRLHQQNIKVLKLEGVTIISESSLIWLKDRYLSKSAGRFIELFTNKETKTLSS
ncbi:LysR family transcriptional regulator [Virgibacillus profundi]|uniref:LysR family transcriptional regulator n=1 Tax=Virgibacillus profundi TaxID=2024555 RepID=A0A2A2IA58_9BACI|nr:LysR family transcriptional regulator [Virgibacillus profundi]PAV28891.1 LysR family transcriptional regulator [Virgibacillus profundi]PXY53059.1 LysR family transcriptional regulator [Virgibacillus profundi]